MADLEKTIKGLEDWINCPFPMDAEIDPKLVHDSLELLKQFRWIPATGQPPEVAESVLVTDGKYISRGFFAGKKEWMCRDIDNYVTHWMPLPPLPEGGKQE